jgi:O-antigen ligase
MAAVPGATSPATFARDASAAGSLWPLIAAGLIVFGAGCGYAIAFGEVAAFSVAVACVAAIAVLFDFRIGAVLLILLLPFAATSFLPRSVLGIPALNPWNILIVATFISYAMRGKLKVLAPPPLIWCVVLPMLAAGLIGLPNAMHVHPSFFETETPQYLSQFGYYRELAVRPLLIPVMAMLVGAAVMRSQKPERFLAVLIPSVWIIALALFGYIIASGVQHLSVLASPYLRGFYDELGVHANQFGRMFAVAYGLLLFAWWEAKDPKFKAAAFLTLGVAALAMVLTFSRAGFLAFFIVNGLFLLWKLNVRTVALALVAGGIAAAAAPSYLWNRITFGWNADANTVSANRIEEIWGPLMGELGNSPIWGNGLGSVMWSDPMLNGEMMAVSHAHNAYLDMYLDMGLIGLALFGFFYWHVWRGFRALGSNAYLSPELRGFFQGATAVLIAFLVTGMSGSSLKPDLEFGFLWLAIGMMYGMLARKPTS